MTEDDCSTAHSAYNHRWLAGEVLVGGTGPEWAECSATELSNSHRAEMNEFTPPRQDG